VLTQAGKLTGIVLKKRFAPSLICTPAAIFRHPETDIFVRALSSPQLFRLTPSTKDKNSVHQRLWNSSFRKLKSVSGTVEVNQQNHESKRVTLHFPYVDVLEKIENINPSFRYWKQLHLPKLIDL